MNDEILAPCRRVDWETYQRVEQIFDDAHTDRGVKAEALLGLGLRMTRVVELLNGRVR